MPGQGLTAWSGPLALGDARGPIFGGHSAGGRRNRVRRPTAVVPATVLGIPVLASTSALFLEATPETNRSFTTSLEMAAAMASSETAVVASLLSPEACFAAEDGFRVTRATSTSTTTRIAPRGTGLAVATS